MSGLRLLSFSGDGGLLNAFTTVQTDAGTSPTASGASTLTLTSTDGTLTITGNSGTNTVNFSVNGTNVGGFTTGSVIFADSLGTLGQDNASFFWDDTNNALSLGRNNLPAGHSFASARGSTEVVGTVSNSSAGTTVTGVGTLFLTTFQQGDLITMNGETRTVLSVSSNTSLTTDAWTGANSGVSYTATSLGAGRISTTASGTTVTGSNTAFLAQFAVGDTLKANGETRTVASVASNTSMTTDAWTNNNTNINYEVFKKLLFGISKGGNFYFGNNPGNGFGGAGPLWRGSYDIVDGGTAQGLNVNVTNAQTAISSSTSNQLVAGSYTGTVGARNINNWTSNFALSGVSGTATINSGAAGTIDSAKAGRFNSTNSSSSATITNAYGVIAFDNFSNSGTITNTYGFYCGDLTTGTQTNTPYSFYASDANAIGFYSAGKVGINATAPTSMLDVVASGSSVIGHIVKGASSQSADLQEWQNSSGTVLLSVSSAGNLTFVANNIATDTTTGTKIGTATTQKFGFYNATPVVQQTDGANLTNNVTSGGTTDTIANYTDLIIYANDAAAIRNDIYQLARKIKIIGDALRTYGLLS